MKWVFLAALISLVPLLTLMLRARPQLLVFASFATGAAMFVISPSAWAAPIPWPGWPGPVQGLEINIIDPIAIALILSTKPVSIPGYIKVSFAIYCLAIAISTFCAYQWEPAVFFIFQLFRAALVFLAVARTCASVARAPVALLAGLGLGLVYEAVFAIYQYHTGDPRPGGNLGHSNFLGLASDFVVLPTMALLLGTRRLFWPGAVLLAGFAIAVVGGSRATLGLYGAGLLIVLILSVWHGASARKMAFSGAAALLLLVAVPVVSLLGNHRTEQSIESSDEERNAMKDAAGMMIADHPLGVGANQYVLVANTGGYSQRAGIAWNYTSRSAPVHDVYYLVTAETGFLGLIGFVAIILSFILLGFQILRRRSKDESNELAPGLLAALIIISVHISFEWVFMFFVIHYLFAAIAGLTVAVAARTASESKRRSTRALPATLLPTV